MKRGAKIKLAVLRRLVKEELTAQPQGAGLGKLVDDISKVFAVKMKETFPTAEEAIQKESNDLKMQLTAMIKAAAAKVKMSAKPS